MDHASWFFYNRRTSDYADKLLQRNEVINMGKKQQITPGMGDRFEVL